MTQSVTDTEILNAMQALLEEQCKRADIRYDVNFGVLRFVVIPPAPIHVPRSSAPIQSGPMPDLRALLTENLQPHLARLVSDKLNPRNQ